jgi:chaperone required for assembly of F1-ATPase
VTVRFYHRAGLAEAEGGFAVTLDGREVKTPARRPLVLPTQALAEAVATEWEAQEKDVRPETMPLTRLANTALDRMRTERAGIVAAIAAYGGSDLLCYIATSPRELRERQEALWHPWRAWAEKRYDVTLTAGEGLMPLRQPPETLAALERTVAACDEWVLTALSEAVPLTGSLVLGLALIEGALDEAKAWRLSRLDEDHQAALWGRDREAEARNEAQRAALSDTMRFLGLARR